MSITKAGQGNLDHSALGSIWLSGVQSPPAICRVATTPSCVVAKTAPDSVAPVRAGTRGLIDEPCYDLPVRLPDGR